MRRKVRSKFLGVLMCVVMAGLVSVPSLAAEKVTLTVWGGRAREVSRGQNAALEIYERAHPEINLKYEVAFDVFSGLDEKSAAKLMIAIASGRPPDVVELNGPVVKGWAARDSLMALDGFIERSEVFEYSDYTPEIYEESSYEGKMYGVFSVIPGGSGWFFWWNKGLFRENGLDPNRPPANWAEIETYAMKLLKLDDRGDIKLLGYHPTSYPTGRTMDWITIAYGNGWEALSPDGRTVLLNDPSAVEALEWVTKVFEIQGGMDKISRFEGGLKPGAQRPFLQNQIAMQINGAWMFNDIGRYKPELEFGVAFHPVKEERPLKKVSWYGGCYVWSIPVGAKHPEEAWDFMMGTTAPETIVKAFEAQEAYIKSIGGYFIPREYIANQRARELIAEKWLPSFEEEASADLYVAVREYIFGLDRNADRVYANFPTPLWSEYWTETERAISNAVYGKMSPQEALDLSTTIVQEKLDEFYEEH